MMDLPEEAELQEVAGGKNAYLKRAGSVVCRAQLH